MCFTSLHIDTLFFLLFPSLSLIFCFSASVLLTLTLKLPFIVFQEQQFSLCCCQFNISMIHISKHSACFLLMFPLCFLKYSAVSNKENACLFLWDIHFCHIFLFLSLLSILTPTLVFLFSHLLFFRLLLSVGLISYLWTVQL